MRLMIAAALLCTTTLGAAAGECDVAAIEKVLTQSLDGLKMTEREVTDIQSTEGGVWRIYATPGGAVHSIMRIDGGESGMGERRLSFAGGGDYGIAVTRVDYLRHAFIEDAGPNGTARRTTEYFYFCGGKLVLPPEQFATLDNKSYANSATEAQTAMVADKDVAEFTGSLPR